MPRHGSTCRATAIVAIGTVIAAAVALPACMESEIVAPDLAGLDTSEEARARAAGYVPDHDPYWEKLDAGDAGFDPERLQQAVAFAVERESPEPADLGAALASTLGSGPDQEIIGRTRARGAVNGMIIRYGYIVAEWGPTRRVDMSFGLAESVLSTLAGVTLDAGRIVDLDEPVARYVDDDGFEGPRNASITWRHLLQQTSEWEGVLWGKPDSADRSEGRERELQEPGTFFEHNSVRIDRLAHSLLWVWRQPLPAVLEREVMTPIDASDTWEWHGYRASVAEVDGTPIASVTSGRWGGGLWINARDLARIALLYLRGGQWGDRRILSESWVEAATSAGPVRDDHGFLWRLNTGARLLPAAPRRAYAALAIGGSVVYVDPVNDIVVVARWMTSEARSELVRLVLEAIDDEPESEPGA